MRVFALLLLWPLLEIGLFVVVGGAIGLWPTLAVVLGTGILGVALIRWQGMGVLRDLQQNGAVDPISPIAHGALILLGGFLLILPGFFTDVLGLMLMIPLVRRGLIAALGPRIQVQGFAASRFRRDPAEDWVDAEYEEVVPDRDKIGGPSKWSRH
jgi:UPF0716 protein FxsA